MFWEIIICCICIEILLLSLPIPITVCAKTAFIDVYKNSFKKELAIAGFRKTGLHPFNPDAPDYSKCASIYNRCYGPSVVFEGIPQDTGIERSTQTEYQFMPSRYTQTTGPTCRLDNESLRRIFEEELPAEYIEQLMNRLAKGGLWK